MKSFGKTIDLIIVFLAISIVPRISTVLTNTIFPLIEHFDKDGVFLWISIHHIFQFLFTLVVMKLYFRSKLDEWGFNLNNLSLSLKIVLYFSIAFTVFQSVPIVIGLITGSVASPSFTYPLIFRNLGGHYAFQGLLSGTAEEPLFRGFVILVLGQSWQGKFKIGKYQITTATLIAALLFAYAHIGFTLSPFEIIKFYPQQLVFALVTGIVYGAVFQKTKSLFGPILLHNLTNVIAISSGYIAYMLSVL